MVTAHVSYGPESRATASSDSSATSAGRRVIELGIADNSIAFALQAAKAIASTPRADQPPAAWLKTSRGAVEFHQGDLGDLGFAPSGSIHLVVALRTHAPRRRRPPPHSAPGPPGAQHWRPVRARPRPPVRVRLDQTPLQGAPLRREPRTDFDLLSAVEPPGRGPPRACVGESAVPNRLVVKVRKLGS